MEPDTRLLAEGIFTCPDCSRSFSNLSQHWSHSPDHRPDIETHQHELITGLVLGDATVRAGGANPILRVHTRFRDFAAWLFEELGWLSRSLRRIPAQDEESDAMHGYRIRTHPHPGLERYHDWQNDHVSGVDGDFHPPEDLSLPSRTVRAWCAKAAYAVWSSDHNSRETGFSAKEEPKRTWIGSYLRRLNLEPTYRHHSWIL